MMFLLHVFYNISTSNLVDYIHVFVRSIQYLCKASFSLLVFLLLFLSQLWQHSSWFKDRVGYGTSKYWITLWLVNARIGLNILSDMIFTFILSAWHFPLSATRRQNFIESTQWAPFRSHDQPSKTALLQTTTPPSPQLTTTTTRCSPAASCPLCFLCCTRTGCKQLLSTAGLESSHDKV